MHKGIFLDTPTGITETVCSIGSKRAGGNQENRVQMNKYQFRHIPLKLMELIIKKIMSVKDDRL